MAEPLLLGHAGDTWEVNWVGPNASITGGVQDQDS